MDAIILAAGKGERIRRYHQAPKGFIVINQLPIVEESILILNAFGIEKIIIVTGFFDQYYQEIAKKYSNVILVHNDEYAVTGSFYSWLLSFPVLTTDFLLIESDIIYPEGYIESILKTKEKNVILVSGETKSDDEVFVEAKNNVLINMSKMKSSLEENDVIGEFVGVNKIAYKTFLDFYCNLDADQNLYKSMQYEVDGLIALSKQATIFGHKMDELPWCEIDTIEHLNRAKLLYHKIRSNSLIFKNSI